MRPSLVSRLRVWEEMACPTSPSLSSMEPCSEPNAAAMSSCCALPSAKPSLTAASTRPSLVSRLAVPPFTADSTAPSFSEAVPLRDSTAFFSRSWADFLSAKPAFTEASIRAILASRLVVPLFIAVSMAPSFSAAVPLRDARAWQTRSYASLSCRLPPLNACSIASSFSKRVALDDLMALTRAL